VDRIGNYRIDCERSRTATAVVYEGRHLVLPRRALIKSMEHKNAIAAVQLLREACILEALEHPGVVKVYESGLLGDRQPWFAYERVDGATVKDLVAHGPLDPPHASALLRDIAQILEHAHRRGIIHCGLRPDRIAVTGRTRGFPLCITEWSDARTHDTSAPPPAPSKPFPDYAAPELVHGDAIDDRADVFALGVIGYQALTGDLPFDGVWLATVADGATQHVPAEVRCPNAPRELTSVVDHMLAWSQWDRPSSAEVFIALASLAADLAPATPQRPQTGPVRIRKPRWTPALTVGEGLPDTVADDVSDEKSD
jgi:serine/threonine-protein kinase